MRKVLFLLLACFVIGSTSQVFAGSDWEAELEASLSDFEKQDLPVVSGNERMVDMKAAEAKSEGDRLARRLSDLERTVKFLQDRVRLLDRKVDDLKRRR